MVRSAVPALMKLPETVRAWFAGQRSARVQKPRSVLVAEARAGERARLKRLLDQLGYESTQVATLDAALEEVTRAQPDFVLLAFDLDGAGLAGLAQIRELVPKVPVIMLATDYHDPRTVQAMRQGAVAYLAQPFGPDDLREVLARR